MSLFSRSAGMDEDAFDPATLMRIATVESVDLAAKRCIVIIGDITSPPVPWLAWRMGKTRIWSPPSVGEQVFLICAEGELGSGVVLPGVPCDAFPHAGDSAEEFIMFGDGARIAYDPDAHSLTAVLPGSATAEITAQTITLNGNVRINGDVAITGTVNADTDVVAAGKSLKSHRHSGVSTGSGQSGPPA